MKVENMTKAFEVVYNTIGEYELDKVSSKVAGYNVFRSTKNHYDYACELGDRVEINTKDGKSFNVWIDETPKKVAELEAKVREQEFEIMKLKAKLYDLVCK